MSEIGFFDVTILISIKYTKYGFKFLNLFFTEFINLIAEVNLTLDQCTDHTMVIKLFKQIYISFEIELLLILNVLLRCSLSAVCA